MAIRWTATFTYIGLGEHNLYKITRQDGETYRVYAASNHFSAIGGYELIGYATMLTEAKDLVAEHDRKLGQ